MALRHALACHTPEIHHSDQGVQYASTAYVQMLEAVDAHISMAEVGQAWQNGYAERLMRTIKEEEVDLAEYEDYGDAYRQSSRPNGSPNGLHRRVFTNKRQFRVQR